MGIFKNSSSNFEIEIEKPQSSQNPINIFDSQSITANELIRNYEHIKLLEINPERKKKLQQLNNEIKDELQRLKRIINTNF